MMSSQHDWKFLKMSHLEEGSSLEIDEKKCYIDDLPNEILVNIFSYLKPKEILYGVGMVCKRWNELSKDSQAWQNVSFFLYDDRRIWRNAPIIGHLEILATLESEVEKVRHLVDSPGPASVRSVKVVIRNPEDTLGILKKYQKFIRVLDVRVGGQGTRPEDWRAFFDAIGKLTELRGLTLRIAPTSTDILYEQQIAVGCRSLQTLCIRGRESIAAALVRDLGSLVTTLVISPSFAEHSVKLTEALAACTAVETLTIPCSMIGALSQFRSLRVLKLITDAAPTSPEQAVENASPSLQTVEKLIISPSRYSAVPDLALNRCISMMARHLKACSYVDLRGFLTLDEYLSEFIHEAKKVQSYDLCCRVYHLLQLEQMECVCSVKAVIDKTGTVIPYVANTVDRLRAHQWKKFEVQFLNL